MKHFSNKEWQEFRRGGIGGSDAGIIMRAVPESWGTIRGLWMEKTNHPDAPKRRSTYAMQQGKLSEPVARAAYEKHTGIKLRKEILVKNIANPFLRATLDGLSEDETRIMEGKCPRKSDHELAVSGKIPPKYIYQCAHQLMVTELDRCDYWSFYKGHGKLVPYYRDEVIERELLRAEIRFWDWVQTKKFESERSESPTESRLLGGGAKIFQLRRTNEK